MDLIVSGIKYDDYMSGESLFLKLAILLVTSFPG